MQLRIRVFWKRECNAFLVVMHIVSQAGAVAADKDVRKLFGELLEHT